MCQSSRLHLASIRVVFDLLLHEMRLRGQLAASAAVRVYGLESALIDAACQYTRRSSVTAGHW